MASKLLFTLVLGALVALTGAPAALGVVTSSVDGANKLTVTTDATDAITIICAGGNVQVNGADPGSGVATCASITSIDVSGGTGGHTINLAGVSAAAFTALTATLLTGTIGSDNIAGSGIGDTIDGGVGSDVITGGPGNDTITPGLGSDSLIFGPAGRPEADTLVLPRGHGRDLLDFSSLAASDPLTADLTGATNTLALHTNRTVSLQAGGFAGAILSVTGGGAGDVLRGHGNSVVLDGGPGNDTLIGGAGNDLLTGNLGTDSMTGGPGDDVYRFTTPVAPETDTVIELANEGTDMLSLDFLTTPAPDITVDLSSGDAR